MQIHPPPTLQRRFPQPLDRVAILLMMGLSVLIGLLLWSGDHTAPRVRDFSWQGKQVGAEDRAFILTFNRPMDRASVQSNLQIEPPLPGKISWAGRRMAYTLTRPAPYGTSYQLQLEGAQDRFSGNESEASLIEPFLGHFTTRDRAFVCLGVEGADAGRLILYNLTQQQKTVLTPPELVVAEFEPYPQGDRILFSATDRAAQNRGSFDPKLYTVSTGIALNSPEQTIKQVPASKVKLVLDNRDAQILKFDLSPDGQSIVVQRADRSNLALSTLWLLQEDTSPQLLDSQPGGDFLITPDSNALVIAQGQGLAVLPLKPEVSSRPLDFLPRFGRVLNFARDGSAAAMVKFNPNETESLYLVSNQGVQKELVRTTGSILSAEFSPLNQTLYCLLTQLLPGPEYRERPYIGAINLQTGKLNPLVILPMQRDLQLRLAPDGTSLLFDQIVSTSQKNTKISQPDQATATTTSKLWLLPLQELAGSVPATSQGSTQQAPTSISPQPQALPIFGAHPRWLF